VVAVLEAGVDGVDLFRRNQRLVEEVAALLGAEIIRVRRRDFRGQTQRADDRIEQIGDDRNAVVACSIDRAISSS